MAPLESEQKAAEEESRKQWMAYQNKIDAWKAARKAAMGKKSDVATKQYALDALGPEPEQPMSSVMMVEEPTYEALVKILQDRPFIGMMSDEGDLGAMNASGTDASFTVTLHAAGGDRSETYVVPAGGQVILVDVVGSLGAVGSGSLQVTSDQPLWLSARIYNLIAADADCSPGGTFGQLYPAYRLEDGLDAGEAGWLTQLAENAAYRTNVSLINTGAGQAHVVVTLFDAAGTEVGSYDVWLGPGQWRQANQPFRNQGGQTDMAAGSARVEVVDGGGVLASASVVNNVTNDPTTIPAME
jgi:hypothetical protein